ncbi:MAG: 3-phosphoshikimate 1-carboxyvinyltransferase, partial [Heliobacteriaceae bacterium]|nr:3-phosphoshikimate 1-carboxyvinyltransferase [Heliobacteriaceae bacterium]
ISAAAFLLVAASLVSGSAVTIRGVGVNPTRDGVLVVLREMGGDIRVENRREVAGEPVADITVKSAALHGVMIQGDIIPRLIDEIPVLAVAALFARGTTEIRDAGELRVKESDRIAVLAGELKKMGALVEELPDGLVVHGGETLRGAMVESHGDHRIAMALAVAGLLARGETTVRDTSCLDVSFPGFAFTLEKLRR